MFGSSVKFLVHAWMEVVWRIKLILACKKLLKWVWPCEPHKKRVALHSNASTTSAHAPQSGYKVRILYAKQPMEKSWGTEYQWEISIESKNNSKWRMQSVNNLHFASPDTNSSGDTRHNGNMEIEEMDCAISERENWACRGSCWACSVEQPRRTMGRLPWPPQGNKHSSRWWIWTMFLAPYAQ